MWQYIVKRLLLMFALLPLALIAADRPTEPMRLWSGAAPGSLGDADKDTPTLTPTDTISKQIMCS